MKKVRYCLFPVVFVLVLFSSCGKKERRIFKATPMLISINNDELEREINFQDIIENIDFIPLETTPESYIGQVGKITFFKSNMIIWDMQSRSILIFDKNGKFLNKISRVGSGPYEYIDINDFCVHPKTGEISIATNTNKILNFSFDLSRCTLYDKIGFFPVAIERFNNGNYAFTSTMNEANVYVADSNMNIIKKGLPNPFKNTSLRSNSISRFGDTILCRLPTFYNDTIYRITADSIVTWCAPDFEFHADYSDPTKLFVDIPSAGRIYNNIEMNGTFNYSETNEFISFEMIYPRKYHDTRILYVIYSKKNKKTTVITPTNVKKTPFEELGFYYVGDLDPSGRITQGISSSAILMSKTKDDSPICRRINELKGQLNEESNPVIMFLKFKE